MVKGKKTKKQTEELTELLQRTQASFENYRKQQEKRTLEIQEQANKDLVSQLLTVLDNFELALKSKESSEEFVNGIELIYSQLFTVLENQGLKPIKTENKVFDPFLHEALMKVESDKPENMILKEIQGGFLLNDRVIRHAKVKISSGAKKEEEAKKEVKEEKQNNQTMEENKNDR